MRRSTRFAKKYRVLFVVLVCGNYQRCKSKPVLLCEGAKSPHIRVVSSAAAAPVLVIQASRHATKQN